MTLENLSYADTARVFFPETVEMKVSKWQKKWVINSWQKIWISLLESASYKNLGVGVSNPNGPYWKSLLDGFSFSWFLIDQTKRNEIQYNTKLSLFEKVAMLYELKLHEASSVRQEKVDSILSGN